jgi:hypothetical protein
LPLATDQYSCSARSVKLILILLVAFEYNCFWLKSQKL